jgi:hypothetical protein
MGFADIVCVVHVAFGNLFQKCFRFFLYYFGIIGNQIFIGGISIYGYEKSPCLLENNFDTFYNYYLDNNSGYTIQVIEQRICEILQY